MATNPLGTSHAYSAGSLQVTATGYDSSHHLTDLYAKNAGGDEVGLGLTDDPSHEDEIASGEGFVQLDVSSLFGLASGASFFTGSTTNGETWLVYGSNTAGALGKLLLSGSNELAYALPGFDKYKYYDFVAATDPDSDQRYNFLLRGLTVTAVPEPASWAMMLLGFGMVGYAMRKRALVRTMLRYS